VEKKRHGRANRQKVMVRGGLPGERARRRLLFGWTVSVVGWFVCGMSMKPGWPGKMLRSSWRLHRLRGAVSTMLDRGHGPTAPLAVTGQRLGKNPHGGCAAAGGGAKGALRHSGRRPVPFRNRFSRRHRRSSDDRTWNPPGPNAVTDIRGWARPGQVEVSRQLRLFRARKTINPSGRVVMLRAGFRLAITSRAPTEIDESNSRHVA
jgi:hypothetical protein